MHTLHTVHTMRYKKQVKKNGTELQAHFFLRKATGKKYIIWNNLFVFFLFSLSQRNAIDNRENEEQWIFEPMEKFTVE